MQDEKEATSNSDGDAKQSTDAVTATCDQAIKEAYLAHTFPAEQPDREMAGDKPGSVVNADPDVGDGEEAVEAVNGDPDENDDQRPAV